MLRVAEVLVCGEVGKTAVVRWEQQNIIRPACFLSVTETTCANRPVFGCASHTASQEFCTLQGLTTISVARCGTAPVCPVVGSQPAFVEPVRKYRLQ